MPTVLDHVDDTSCSELYRFSNLYDYPDFVKSASSDELIPEDLENAAFADPLGRHYPCHNKAATWLSYLYFKEKKASLETLNAKLIEHNLNDFIQFWNLKSAAAAVDARYEDLRKTAALPDDAYAFNWTDAQGVKHNNLRVTSAIEVKTAAEWLFAYRDVLPYAHRAEIAVNLLEKAASFGAAIGSRLEQFLERQAGRGVCDTQQVAHMLDQRVKLAYQHPDLQKQIQALADCARTQPSIAFSPGEMQKMAVQVDKIDEQIGIKGKYTAMIQRPEDVIFGVTFKEATASISTAVPLVTGRIYNRNDFSKIALQDLKNLMGNKLAEEVASGLDVDADKLAEIAETMPRDDAHDFEQILKQSGISPIYAKAATDAYGLSAEAVIKLADGY